MKKIRVQMECILDVDKNGNVRAGTNRATNIQQEDYPEEELTLLNEWRATIQENIELKERIKWMNRRLMLVCLLGVILGIYAIFS